MFCRSSSSLLFFFFLLAVTIQRQGMVTLLQYRIPHGTRVVFTVCCSFTIITLYSIITRTITKIHRVHRLCVCLCVCACLCMCV